MTFDNYTIRLINEDEGDKFFRIMDSNRKRLEDYFAGTVAKTRTIEDTRAYVTEMGERIRNKTYLPFVIVDNTTGEFTGLVDVKNIDWNVPKAELGCFFDGNHTGKGLAERALRSVLEHLESEYKFIKLFLRTHDGNTTARKLAGKCGFELEGRIRKDYKTTGGEVIDCLYYGRIND